MNIQRIAIALLWLVTVVAAYFIGGSNETNPGRQAAQATQDGDRAKSSASSMAPKTIPDASKMSRGGERSGNNSWPNLGLPFSRAHGVLRITSARSGSSFFASLRTRKFQRGNYSWRRKMPASSSRTLPMAERFLNSCRVIKRDLALSSSNTLTCWRAKSAS